MKARSLLSLGLCLSGWLILTVGSAHAQLTKIFVASTGNDANDGSRSFPKRNFQAAHDAVAVGGEVVALDTAGYGALNITKSVGITAPAGITGFITTTGGTNGIFINAGTGSVSLRGLTINAVNKTGAPRGVATPNVGTLTVSNCTISGYSNGIDLSGSTNVTAIVTESTLRSNAGSGIIIGSSAAADVNLVVDGCELAFNGGGVSVLVSATGGVSHRIVVRNTLVAGHTSTGITISGANEAVLQHSAFSANPEAIRSTSGAVINVDNCAVTGNTTGLFSSGGALLTRSNNTVEDNGTDGAFTGTYSAK